MKMTLKEVARIAGVSYPTASRALGPAPKKVGSKTIRHVHEVAARLGYRPDVAARALVSKHVPYIGMMFGTEDPSGSLGDVFREEAPLLGALCKSLAREDYHLVLDSEWSVVGVFEEEAIGQPPRLLRQHHVSGVLVMHYIWPGLYQAVTRWKIPCVGINAEPVLGMPEVSVDRSFGAAAAVEYLVSLGHRRIAFLPGSNLSAYVASKMRTKVLGYVSGMDNAGLPLFAGWNVEIPESHDKAVTTLLPRMMKADGSPTAILTYDDYRAIKVIEYLRDHGFQVPKDVSVLSLQESAVGESFVPSVTTVGTPAEELADKAMEILLRQVNNEPVAERQVFVQPRVVVRKSTGPPRE